MNALPTATACALPHGQAHGIPRAIQSGSVAGTVHAKRSEVKGPEVKTPEVKTPDLKGPEVKMNQPWSPSHHGVQKVDASDSAPIVAPSPVTTPDAMMSLAAIEHLDFEPTCESPAGCDTAADYAIAARCPRCGRAWERVAFACAEHWASADISPRRCPDCSHVAPRRNFWRIVQVLR